MSEEVSTESKYKSPQQPPLTLLVVLSWKKYNINVWNEDFHLHTSNKYH